MPTKMLFRWLLVVSLFVIGVLLITETTRVRAQCGEPQASSCTSCHAQEDPVNENGEWHIIHASEDICINCHGGNGTAMDKDLAHEGLIAQPLEDIYTDCHGCHPDYDERAARFASTLGVTPSSCATPTPVSVGNVSGEPPSNSINTQTGIINTTPSLPPFTVVGFLVGILSLFLLGVNWIGKHHVTD